MIKALSVLTAIAILSTVSIVSDAFAENANCSRDCEAPTIGVLDNGQRIVEKGLTINGRSFDVVHQIQSVTTTNINTGGTVKVTLVVYENNGVSGIRQVALSIADYKDDRNRNELATISYNQDFTGMQSVSLVDPEGIIKDITVKPTQIDQFRTSLEFSFKVVKPFEKSAILVQSFDADRSSRTNVFLAAIAASGKPIADKAQPVADKQVPVPLKQVKTGIKAQNVECKPGLELVFRAKNGSPLCVYPHTAEILRSLGIVK